MSVERYYMLFDSVTKKASMEPIAKGAYVLHTDYQRDCIKGRCGGCKHTMNAIDKSDVFCNRHNHLVLLRKKLDGYCDEFEPRECAQKGGTFKLESKECGEFEPREAK